MSPVQNLEAAVGAFLLSVSRISSRGLVPPPRPSWREERWALRLFVALAPGRPDQTRVEPPEELAPFVAVSVPRSTGGTLAGYWFGDPVTCRGAAVLAHPWTPRGQAYLYRHRRIDALRELDLAVLTFDVSGFGASPPPRGLFDRDLDDVLSFAAAALGTERPLYFWGLSNGGYWAHLALSRRRDVTAAFFEDVASHMLRWSRRVRPWGMPAYLVFQYFLRRTYRYIDLYRHAPALCGMPVGYVGGGRDPGIPAEETERLARLAGSEALIVPDAGHLGGFKLAPKAVVERVQHLFTSSA